MGDKFNIAWLIDYVNSLKTGEKPEPGYLEGVKSKGKALLKMANVEFKYPTQEKPTLHGVGVQVSMLSRVAIVGPNGAGKSTMIKCLLGELKPTKGTINKQQGARIAYMSQHAFHHIEQHLDKSGTEYILQRFAGGEDNEAIENLAALGATKDNENQKIFKYKWVNGELKECDTFYDDEGEHYQEKELKLAVKLDCITQRRNQKKDKEYECKWQGMSMDSLTWVSKAQLIKMGYKKEVQREDEKIAAQQGLQTKMLTTPCVEAHLKDFGVDPEFATHNPLKALSAGQKVKIVLAAAMWQNPHVLVIDEPTNYLDRDALGALTEAIEKYNGGVVVISHNMDFCNRVATEKWIMDAGHLTAEGGNYCDEKIEENQEEEEIFDAAGNKIDVKRNKTLSDKEKKKAIKDLEKKLKENKKKKNLTE